MANVFYKIDIILLQLSHDISYLVCTWLFLNNKLHYIWWESYIPSNMPSPRKPEFMTFCNDIFMHNMVINTSYIALGEAWRQK